MNYMVKSKLYLRVVSFSRHLIHIHSMTTKCKYLHIFGMLGMTRAVSFSNAKFHKGRVLHYMLYDTKLVLFITFHPDSNSCTIFAYVHVLTKGRQ